jgi:hypothetical protein
LPKEFHMKNPVSEPSTSATSRFGMAAICGVVAVLAAIASALGVLARGSGEFITVTSVRGETYDMARSGVYAWNAQRVVAEGVGWDIVTLFVAVPALVLAARLVARGSFRGRLFAVGLLGYFLYQYLEYAVTWALGPLFLLFVVIYATSLVGIAWIGWSLVKEHPATMFAERFPRRGWATLNLAMSALLTLLWLQRISMATRGEPGLLLGETTLTVQALDLGLLVPTSVLTAILVLRRTEIGYTLAASFGVTFAMMTTAIAAMLVSAAVIERTVEIVPLAIFALASLAAIALLIRSYRPAADASRTAAVAQPVRPATPAGPPVVSTR